MTRAQLLELWRSRAAVAGALAGKSPSVLNQREQLRHATFFASQQVWTLAAKELEAIEEPRALRGLTPAEAYSRAQDALRRVGLDDNPALNDALAVALGWPL